jgi:amidase
MTDLGYRTASDLVAALEAKEVGSRELLDHLLARVEEHDPKLNAVVTLDGERARAAAEEADAATARGDDLGPLHGLPMTVKDVFETEGVRTTSGAVELCDHVPTADATAVARLKAAGAVVFGKTNTPTYASDIQTFNPVFGTTNNPWAVNRTTGGSSGGSAAALAAGLTPLELGSDIGGSIRNPSHFCGTVGHKPSWGIVPLRGHIPGPPGLLTEADVNVVGPMARSVEDVVLGLDVVAGPAGHAAAGWRLELPEAKGDLRYGAWLEDPHLPVAPDVAAVLDAAVQALTDEGSAVDRRARPAFETGQATHLFEQLVYTQSAVNAPPEAWEMAAAVEAMPVGEDEPALVRGARAIAMRHRDWMVLNELRLQQRVAWAELFEAVDVLLCPVIPVAAFPHQTDDDPVGILNRTIDVGGRVLPHAELTHWAGIVGVALLPSTVVPVGFTPDGLPVGVQVVADFLQDRTALAAAAHLEQVLGGFQEPPGFGGAAA